MKVHTVTKPHPLETVAHMAAKQVTHGHPERGAGLDATMLAMSTVQEVLAHVKTETGFWHGMGVRIIVGATDYRAQFVKQLDKALQDMRAANAQALDPTVNSDGKPDPAKDARKQASTNVAVMGVQISRLRGLAEAFNGGATIPGLIEFHAAQGKASSDGLTLDNVSWSSMHQYAVKFRKSTAGRPKHSWLTKFGKWLEGAGKLEEDASPEEQKQFAQAMALYNKLAPKVDAAPM